MKKIYVLFFTVCMFDLIGCTGPRYVTDTTSRGSKIKLVYEGDDGQGVLECDKAENGALSNCQNISIEFQE